MGKEFNLGSKSDMRKLERQLKDDILGDAKSQVEAEGFEIECPHCHKTAIFHSGQNTCLHCGETITVEIDW